MLTIRDICKELHVSPETARGLIVSGRLAAIDVSTHTNGKAKKARYRVSRESLEAFVRGAAVIVTPPKTAVRNDQKIEKFI
jgi:hypothetical protein